MSSSTTDSHSSVDDLRASLRATPVDATTFNANPVVQLVEWYKDACYSRAVMPDAMVLSSVAQCPDTGTMLPSSRAVLLKDVLLSGSLYSAHAWMKQAAAGAPRVQTWLKDDLASPAHHSSPSSDAATATAAADGVFSAGKYFSAPADQPLLRHDSLVFATNYDSRKGVEIAANPWVSVYFLWHELERAVRVEGASYSSSDPVPAFSPSCPAHPTSPLSHPLAQATSRRCPRRCPTATTRSGHA